MNRITIWFNEFTGGAGLRRQMLLQQRAVSGRPEQIIELDNFLLAARPRSLLTGTD